MCSPGAAMRNYVLRDRRLGFHLRIDLAADNATVNPRVAFTAGQQTVLLRGTAEDAC